MNHDFLPQGTIAARMNACGGVTSGFDYLRLFLAIAVVCIHSIDVCYGSVASDALWTGPYRQIAGSIVPLFFALSGFLVAGSLARSRTLTAFATYRGVRIMPALTVEVFLSALVIGPIFTSLPLSSYFTAPEFYQYFLNILGIIHYNLPGVFSDLPREWVNRSLWSIPHELGCYLLLLPLAFMGVAKNRFTLLICAATFCFYVTVITAYAPANQYGNLFHYPSFKFLLITSFLGGVALYNYKDKIRLSLPLFILSLAAIYISLSYSSLVQLAAFPMAYVAGYLGMLNPSKNNILMRGDYSYGLYLFTYPIQQAYVSLFPDYRIWSLNIAFSLFFGLLYAVFSWHLIESVALKHKHNLAAYFERQQERLFGKKSNSQ